MGTKFFYTDIDLVYFVNNKLINSCTSTAYSFGVTELLARLRSPLTNRRFVWGMHRREYKSLTHTPDKSSICKGYSYLNPLQVAVPLGNPHISFPHTDPFGALLRTVAAKGVSKSSICKGYPHTYPSNANPFGVQLVSKSSDKFPNLNPLAKQRKVMCGLPRASQRGTATCKGLRIKALSSSYCAYPIQVQISDLSEDLSRGYAKQSPKGNKVCGLPRASYKSKICLQRGTVTYNTSDLINQKDRVLLSFSGGQDSICFVFILNQLYCQLELDITFFWCHHLWQTDSFYLMQQIAKLGFLFQFNSFFPIPLSCLSSELLARKWRQSCSYRVSLFYNYSKIGLAHTFNDKIENIFLNFIRGTGLIGLTPLRWIQLAKRISKPNIILDNFVNTAHTNPLQIYDLYGVDTPFFCISRKSKALPFQRKPLRNPEGVSKPHTNLLTNLRFVLSTDPEGVSVGGTASTHTNRRFRDKLYPEGVCVEGVSVGSFAWHNPFRGKHSSCQTNLRFVLSMRTAKSNFCKPSSNKAWNLFCNSNNRSVKGNPLLSFAPKRSKVEDFIEEELTSPHISFPHTDPFAKHGVSKSSDKSSSLNPPHTTLNLDLDTPCFAKGSVWGNEMCGLPRASQRGTATCKKYALEGNVMCGLNKSFNKEWSKQLLDGCYIVRPFLSISRIELNKICYFWELPIYPDKSNQKVKFLRNRVRGQLLPTIKLFFNLNIENIFVQLAKIVETEDYCLTQIVNELTKNTDLYHTKLDIYSKRKK